VAEQLLLLLFLLTRVTSPILALDRRDCEVEVIAAERIRRRRCINYHLIEGKKASEVKETLVLSWNLKKKSMGFRLRNLNPIYRTCITRLSSSNSPPPFLESLNCHPLQSCLTENPAFKIPKRWHLGHSHHDEHDRRHKEGENIFRLGLAADICLATGKAVTGYLSGSTAIIADAAHSVSDVVSANSHTHIHSVSVTCLGTTFILVIVGVAGS